MPHPVSVSVLPELLPAGGLAGRVAVVIDVLRATTTIVHALAHGAREVIPCVSIEEAGELRRRLSAAAPLTGGERRGVRIDGFDLDNSPASYTPERIAGKTILFTSTNGTKAVAACRSADRVLLAAFVNRAAVLNALCAEERAVHLVCAGTDGMMTAEDILLAGVLADELIHARGLDFERLDVETQLVVQFAQSRTRSKQLFEQTLRTSRGGQNLTALGYEEDIRIAGQLDLFDIVPQWDAVAGVIRRAV